MKISDILRISIVGLSAFSMLHLARQGNTPRNNPRTKTPPTEAEIAQAKALIDQIPQATIDIIIQDRRDNNLTSKQISKKIGFTTQQVWDTLKALEVLKIYVPKERLGVDLSERMTPDFIRSLHDVYMGAGRPKIEEVAKIADVSTTYLLKKFEQLQLPIKRPSIAKFEEARVRALFEEYTGPNLPTLVTLAKTAGMDASTLLRRFQALGLQAKIYGRTAARNVKLANPGIDFDQLYSDFQNIKIPLAMLEGKYHCNLNQIIQALEYYDYPLESKRLTQCILWSTIYTDEIVEKYNSGMNIYEVYESLKDTLSLSLVVILAARSGVVFRDTEPVIQYHLQGYSINRIRILTNLAYSYEIIRVLLKAAGYLSENKEESNEESNELSKKATRLPPPVTPEEIELQTKLPLVGSEILNRIPKDLFQNIYYNDSSLTEKCELLKISRPTFLKLKRYYGLN